MNEKPKVLVVEDNPVSQLFAKRSLEPYAMVIIAASLNAARRALKNEQSISFVILDGYVPHYDNEPLRADDTTLELAKYIALKYQIPMYSASSDEELNKKLADAGCVHTNKETSIKAVIVEIERQQVLRE